MNPVVCKEGVRYSPVSNPFAALRRLPGCKYSWCAAVGRSPKDQHDGVEHTLSQLIHHDISQIDCVLSRETEHCSFYTQWQILSLHISIPSFQAVTIAAPRKDAGLAPPPSTTLKGIEGCGSMGNSIHSPSGNSGSTTVACASPRSV
jgi:hypothetical protein